MTKKPCQISGQEGKLKPLAEVPDEMRNRIHRMARRTWDAIGCDVINDIGGGKDISRAEVLELVQDAGRMYDFGGDKEAYEFWKKLSPALQDKVVGEVFPSKWYGM